MESVLLSWIGQKDLDSTSSSRKSGPIKQTLNARDFERAILLYNYDSEDEVRKVDVLAKQLSRNSKVEIDCRHLALQSPIHFGDIYSQISPLLDEVAERQLSPTILLTPGTPAMQAVWILANKSGPQYPMLVSSEQAGVQDEKVPFDIDAAFKARIGKTKDWVSEWAKRPIPSSEEFNDIKSNDPKVALLKKQAAELAQYDLPVLLLGETGTGKELFAAAIHYQSPRNFDPFEIVNCGAIPENLIDSELFGAEKGAFTGATAARQGKIAAADGGTLFLDEFGEMSLETQVRLLRVLQQGEFTPVGSTDVKKVNVRVIAATNRDLPEMIAEGKFREDLYYRVATGVLTLPPLRERTGDVELLSGEFLAAINSEFGSINDAYQPRKLSPAALRVLKQHTWPGNIRELESALKAACLWTVKPTIDEETMRQAIPRSAKKPGFALHDHLESDFNLSELLESVKRHYVNLAIRTHPTNKAAAAKSLGASRQTMANWLKTLGIK